METWQRSIPRFNIGRSFLEEAMFLCQPLLEVLAGRGIEDIEAFLKVPSWHDLPDPFSIPLPTGLSTFPARDELET